MLQDHHPVFVVFWIGIAFWLLFALIPSEKLLAMIQHKVDQVRHCAVPYMHHMPDKVACTLTLSALLNYSAACQLSSSHSCNDVQDIQITHCMYVVTGVDTLCSCITMYSIR